LARKEGGKKRKKGSVCERCTNFLPPFFPSMEGRKLLGGCVAGVGNIP